MRRWTTSTAAAIETIHAFAARVLALYPLEAGLPPGFGIMDDTESGAEFAERWRDHIDGVLERRELAMPLRSAFDAGITLEHLAEVARKLHDDWDRARSNASVMAEQDDRYRSLRSRTSIRDPASPCVRQSRGSAVLPFE